MVPGIRFQVNEVRRPERVVRSLASDFRQGSVPYREAELREGFRREASTADAALPRPAARASDSTSPAPANVVPYEVLQLAARGESIPASNARRDDLGALEAERIADEEAELGPFEKPIDDDPFRDPEQRPFDEQQPFDKSAPDNRFGYALEAPGEAAGAEPANVFERPKEAAEPFGRSIPFDLSAKANDEQAVEGKPFSRAQDAKREKEDELAGFVARDHDLALAIARGSVLPEAPQQRPEAGAAGARPSELPISKTQASGVSSVIQGLLQSVQRDAAGSGSTSSAAQETALKRTLAQFASQRYQSADQNEFTNEAALRTDNAQRWSRIGITRPSFALSLTV